MCGLDLEEEAAARQAGLVVFADRIVHAAQPPIDEVTRARVERVCAGPLPDDLVELWSSCFGGALDYHLEADLGGHRASVSFCELFYPDSGHYHDLWGWIDEEFRFDQAKPERLEFLPIGGFEYLDRVYVQVSPGEHHGSIVVWKQGLPPAWTLRLHEDRAARVASSLRDLFQALVLDDDPFDPSEEYSSGQDLVAEIDRLDALGGVAATAASKLRRSVRSSIVDWRATLEGGLIVEEMMPRHLAWREVARSDDLELLEDLLDRGCDAEERLLGGGTIVDLALARGASRVSSSLIEQGVSVEHGIRNAARLDLELTELLLERGAVVDSETILKVLRSSGLEVASRLISAFDGTSAERLDLASRARARAEREEQSADRVESGKMGSNVEPDEYRRQASLLRSLAESVEESARQPGLLIKLTGWLKR